MKFRVYTKMHRTDILERLDPEERFSSEEHTLATKMESSGRTLTKESILRDFLSKESKKLIPLSCLIRFVQENRYTKILSLGSGACVPEYLLKASLPENSIVVATDFDRFHIENAKKSFPSIVPLHFDFFHDDIRTIVEAAGTGFDMAYFMNSSYVMDDVEYVRILEQLRRSGIKKVMDLTSTFISLWSLPKLVAGVLKWKIFHDEMGKFHGFSRTRGEFRILYRKAGWHLSRETRIGDYNYIAILENRD